MCVIQLCHDVCHPSCGIRLTSLERMYLPNTTLFVGRGLYNIAHCIYIWILVGKPEGKRPLGSPGHRWVDNIRMDLQEVGCGHVVWIGLAQDRDRWRTLVSTVMNLRVP